MTAMGLAWQPRSCRSRQEKLRRWPQNWHGVLRGMIGVEVTCKTLGIEFYSEQNRIIHSFIL